MVILASSRDAGVDLLASLAVPESMLRDLDAASNSQEDMMLYVMQRIGEVTIRSVGSRLIDGGWLVHIDLFFTGRRDQTGITPPAPAREICGNRAKITAKIAKRILERSSMWSSNAS
jgi:hypothetical protein